MSSQAGPELVLQLCHEVAQQVDAQAACLATGNLGGLAGYTHSVELLLQRLQQELALLEGENGKWRECATNTLQRVLTQHEANVQLLEGRAKALRDGLIGDFKRATGIEQYQRVRKGRQPGR